MNMFGRWKSILLAAPVAMLLWACPVLPQEEAAAPADEVVLDGATLQEALDSMDQDELAARAAQHYEQALELHMKGDLESAVFEYRDAIMLDPDVAAYHADLGFAYHVLGEVRLAIESMERAIELDPKLGNAYTTLGVIYDSQNLLVKAVEFHRKAVKADPEHFVAYNNLGHAYDRLGLIKAAMANYEQAIEINPDFAPAYDNLGVNYMNLGQVEKGLTYIEKAIALTSPNDINLALYLNDKGAAYVMLNDLDAAYEAFGKAARMAPGNEDIQRNYMFIKMKIEERDHGG